MKRPFAWLGALVLLSSLFGLFGCNTQEESKTQSTMPGGVTANGSAATPGKKGSPPMPGP